MTPFATPHVAPLTNIARLNAPPSGLCGCGCGCGTAATASAASSLAAGGDRQRWRRPGDGDPFLAFACSCCHGPVVVLVGGNCTGFGSGSSGGNTGGGGRSRVTANRTEKLAPRLHARRPQAAPKTPSIVTGARRRSSQRAAVPAVVLVDDVNHGIIIGAKHQQ